MESTLLSLPIAEMPHEHQFGKNADWQRNLPDANKPSPNSFSSRQAALGDDLGL